MGIPEDVFVGNVAADFKCTICSEVFEDPCSCRAGHIFCRKCILTWLVRKRSCPTCRIPLYAQELTTSLLARNLIGAMHVVCEHRKASKDFDDAEAISQSANSGHPSEPVDAARQDNIPSSPSSSSSSSSSSEISTSANTNMNECNRSPANLNECDQSPTFFSRIKAAFGVVDAPTSPEGPTSASHGASASASPVTSASGSPGASASVSASRESKTDSDREVKCDSDRESLPDDSRATVSSSPTSERPSRSRKSSEAAPKDAHMQHERARGRGCLWTGALSRRAKHLENECAFTLLECACGARFARRDEALHRERSGCARSAKPCVVPVPMAAEQPQRAGAGANAPPFGVHALFPPVSLHGGLRHFVGEHFSDIDSDDIPRLNSEDDDSDSEFSIPDLTEEVMASGRLQQRLYLEYMDNNGGEPAVYDYDDNDGDDDDDDEDEDSECPELRETDGEGESEGDFQAGFDYEGDGGDDVDTDEEESDCPELRETDGEDGDDSEGDFQADFDDDVDIEEEEDLRHLAPPPLRDQADESDSDDPSDSDEAPDSDDGPPPSLRVVDCFDSDDESVDSPDSDSGPPPLRYQADNSDDDFDDALDSDSEPPPPLRVADDSDVFDSDDESDGDHTGVSSRHVPPAGTDLRAEIERIRGTDDHNELERLHAERLREVVMDNLSATYEGLCRSPRRIVNSPRRVVNSPHYDDPTDFSDDELSSDDDRDSDSDRAGASHSDGVEGRGGRRSVDSDSNAHSDGDEGRGGRRSVDSGSGEHSDGDEGRGGRRSVDSGSTAHPGEDEGRGGDHSGRSSPRRVVNSPHYDDPTDFSDSDDELSSDDDRDSDSDRVGTSHSDGDEGRGGRRSVDSVSGAQSDGDEGRGDDHSGSTAPPPLRQLPSVSEPEESSPRRDPSASNGTSRGSRAEPGELEDEFHLGECIASNDRLWEDDAWADEEFEAWAETRGGNVEVNPSRLGLGKDWLAAFHGAGAARRGREARAESSRPRSVERVFLFDEEMSAQETSPRRRGGSSSSRLLGQRLSGRRNRAAPRDRGRVTRQGGPTPEGDEGVPRQDGLTRQGGPIPQGDEGVTRQGGPTPEGDEGVTRQGGYVVTRQGRPPTRGRRKDSKRAQPDSASSSRAKGGGSRRDAKRKKQPRTRGANSASSPKEDHTSKPPRKPDPDRVDVDLTNGASSSPPKKPDSEYVDLTAPCNAENTEPLNEQ